jgi:hypothetical protein
VLPTDATRAAADTSLFGSDGKADIDGDCADPDGAPTGAIAEADAVADDAAGDDEVL